MSTLLQLRQKLVRDSGRYGLVVDAENGDWTDNGANALLNQGQKWLDRKFEYDKQQSWFTTTVVSGQSLVQFNKARYIERVELADTTNGRTVLQRKTRAWLATEYADVPLSALDTGEPLYWAPVIVGLAPQQYGDDAADLTTAGVTDKDWYLYGNHYPYSAIEVFPPSDSTRTIKVLARWTSKELTDDADVSVWSVNEPEMLVRAARLQIESDLHRSDEGQSTFEKRLLDDLDGLYKDFLAEIVAGPASDWVMNG